MITPNVMTGYDGGYNYMYKSRGAKLVNKDDGFVDYKWKWEIWK